MKKFRWLLAVAAILLLGAATFVVRTGLVRAAAGGGKVLVAGVAKQAEEVAEAGIVVIHVEPESPAAQAGVRRGDILLRVDDAETNQLPDLVRALEGKAAGDTVTLSVLHGDEARTLTATLDERADHAYLGIVACGGPGPDRLFLALSEGAHLVEVEEGSPAASAGLQAGETIVSVDGSPVTLPHTLKEQIATHAPGDEVTLEVRGADGANREVAVTLGAHPDDATRPYLGVRFAPAAPRGALSFEHRLPLTDTLPLADESFRWEFFLPEGEVPSDTFGLPPLHAPDWLPAEGADVALTVGEVQAGSPAAEAGLQTGDQILALDGEVVGEVIRHPREFAERIRAHAPGDRVRLTHQRAGEEPREIEVTLGEDEAGNAYLGIGLNFTVRFEGQHGEGGIEWAPFPALPLPEAFPLPDVLPAPAPCLDEACGPPSA